MKKTLAFLLALLLIFSLAGCKKKPVYTIDADVSQFKAGILFAGDPETPYSSDAAHYAGIVSAMESYGMDVSSQLLIAKDLGRDEEAVTDALYQLIDDGANVIFGTDYTYQFAMEACASSNPEVAFAHCGSEGVEAANFVTYFGRMYQASYLAGIAAGAKTLELENNTVGYVSNFGVEYSENASAINAFTLGVQAINPDAQIYVMPINQLSDPESEASYAEDFVASYKCGVIGQFCNSALPLQAAKQWKAFGCGCGTDLNEAAPEAHLVSALWNWDVYYLQALKAAAECESAQKFVEQLGSADYYGGIKEGLVDISSLSENCPEGTADAIQEVKQLLISGKWDVFSGVKLQITLNGKKATVKQYDDPLLNQLEEEVLAPGEASLPDEFIRSMSYFLISVLDA